MRNLSEVIEDIRRLIRTEGYIYALALVLFEDFHINPEKLHELDNRSRLNVNEAAFLLGFLVQQDVAFAFPASSDDLLSMKKRTYELLRELHDSFAKPFIERLKTAEAKIGSESKKDFLGRGDMLTEPIFYAGSGVYDFQYLEFLGRKYGRDTEWLENKRGFRATEARDIFGQIKNWLQEKSTRVNLYAREAVPQVIQKLKSEHKDDHDRFDKALAEMMPMIEMHQYVDLFFDDSLSTLEPSSNEFREAAWRVFYRNLIELSCINTSDIEALPGGKKFIENFSILPGNGTNSRFHGIGDYNVVRSHPLIRISETQIFLPIPFILAEAIYESPFYWMMADEAYRDISAANRGDAGEDTTFEFLSGIFRKNTYKRVKISSKKGATDTDVDVLCILGSKALCVQTKSQKLTELSRKGNDEALTTDFKRAVQDAYSQGITARKRLLDRSATFMNENGVPIEVSEEINEVYLAVVTTENYPSLTHQANTLLERKEGEPAPFVLTVFELELLAHYLSDPYDFLYYVRQRIALTDYFSSQEEMTFLGFHLLKKLWKNPEADFVALDNDWAQVIDRNYFPYKAGIPVPDDTDPLSKRWKNEEFTRLCKEIASAQTAEVTDILFHLFDLSGSARDKLIELIVSTKRKTQLDGKFHNFSMPPGKEGASGFGITYFSSETTSVEYLRAQLTTLSAFRKYKCRSDAWLGMGSVLGSGNWIDGIVYNDQPWKFDETLEEGAKSLENTPKYSAATGKKIGRNEKCPCGSGKKFKRCCIGL